MGSGSSGSTFDRASALGLNLGRSTNTTPVPLVPATGGKPTATVDSKPVAIPNPRAARAMGIGMVFQHFSLFEALTVLENIALGLDERLAPSDLERRIREVLARYGLTLDPHRTVATLSVGERQRIEIVRALLLNPTLLIMDEPTSVLTPQEVEQLFVVLRQLAKHPLTDIGLERFLADWEKVKNRS